MDCVQCVYLLFFLKISYLIKLTLHWILIAISISLALSLSHGWRDDPTYRYHNNQWRRIAWYRMKANIGWTIEPASHRTWTEFLSSMSRLMWLVDVWQASFLHKSVTHLVFFRISNFWLIEKSTARHCSLISACGNILMLFLICRPDQSDGICSLQEPHLPRRKAGELPRWSNVKQEVQPDTHHRLRPRQGIHRSNDTRAHRLPWAQEPNRHRALHEH